jgi:hypothetical protein
MNPTDEVVAKTESAEWQSAGALAGPGDWLSKFDEPFLAALKDVGRASDQQMPAENLRGSDVELNERLDDLPRPRSLPEDVENLLSQSSQYLDDETSERTIIRHRLIAIENEVRKRGARGFARYLIAICIGAAVISAWQSYGEATKQIISTTAPELSSSPETKQMIAQKVQQLEVDIVAVRQTIEQRLAVQQQTVEQLASRQDQMVSEITRLQAADQKILEKIPAPPPPLRKASFRHKHSRRLSVSTKKQ